VHRRHFTKLYIRHKRPQRAGLTFSNMAMTPDMETMMTEPTTPESPAASPAPASATPAPVATKRRKWPWIVGGLAAVTISGAVMAQTFAPPRFMGHGMSGGFEQMDPARMAEFADKGVRHLAIEIDATTEQQEKLRAIVRDLTKDLAPLRGARQDAASRARSLLTSSNLDKADIEKFRAEQLSKADAVSKRITQAIADAAEVLTPEQRRKLADRIPQRGSGPFWRRG
jgi:protein CpxP